MAKKSRVKGQRGQNEWAKFVGGTVLARAGYDGADVESPPMVIRDLTLWEVKRRKALPQWLRDWMYQAEMQVVGTTAAIALAFREDHGEWWLLIPASELLSDDV